jgi:hypothetical protein
MVVLEFQLLAYNFTFTGHRDQLHPRGEFHQLIVASYSWLEPHPALLTRPPTAFTVKSKYRMVLSVHPSRQVTVFRAVTHYGPRTKTTKSYFIPNKPGFDLTHLQIKWLCWSNQPAESLQRLTGGIH